MGSMLSDPQHLISLKTTRGSSLNIKKTGEISVLSPVNNGVTIKQDGSVSVTSVAGVSISIDVAGNINLVSSGTIDVKATQISLHGEINLNTLPNDPGFGLLPFCPLTGAKTITSKTHSTP